MDPHLTHTAISVLNALRRERERHEVGRTAGGRRDRRRLRRATTARFDVSKRLAVHNHATRLQPGHE